MATRSTIAIQNADGSVTGIYCHSDGYFRHNGRILQNHYTDEAKVRELIALGNLSSLGEDIGVKVDFEDYKSHKGQCVAYVRDRGETGNKPRTCHNWRQFIAENGQEYDYLYDVAEQRWRVSHNGVGWLDEALEESDAA
jgi:hypothetical protein